MKNSPFQENPESLVSVCNHVLNGCSLHWVHHLPEEKYLWHLMCIGEHKTSDMVQITLEEACRLFPEFQELGDVPPTMDVSFKRGKNSGKWYDFHRGK